MIVGILLGLLAALAQSLTYVLSRIFVGKPGCRPLTLFALSHALIGLFSAFILPFCWTSAARDFSAYAWSLLGTAGFYMAGQYCLFQAIKWTEASRVSPLLGLKIPILSLLSVFLLRQSLSPYQWLAVAMSLFAALILNYAGGGIRMRSVAGVLFACITYSCSDLCIVRLTRVLSPDGGFRGSVLSTCLAFLLAGFVGVGISLIGSREDRSTEKWFAALPVALVWFVAQLCLFACFNLTGAVLGNIVQAMRGPFSILLGAVIAALGFVHLEERARLRVVVSRVAASLLMVAAIGLFSYKAAESLAFLVDNVK